MKGRQPPRQTHENCDGAPTSYTFEWFQRGHQLKATNMSLECEPTQLKVLHECIRGISCELALWIHKAVFIPSTLSLIQEAEGEGSFWSQPVPLFFFFFFLSLGAKEDWVSLICSLYIWMSSAKSSSWPPDKGPGAETVAVPNLASVGAVNHQGLGGGSPPFEDTRLLYWLICGQKGKPFSPAPFTMLSLSLSPQNPERPSGGAWLITCWYARGPSIRLHKHTLHAVRSRVFFLSKVKWKQTPMTLQGLSHSQKNSSSNKKFDSIFRSNVGNYIFLDSKRSWGAVQTQPLFPEDWNIKQSFEHTLTFTLLAVYMRCSMQAL